jgi:hypothetical protein
MVPVDEASRVWRMMDWRASGVMDAILSAIFGRAGRQACIVAVSNVRKIAPDGCQGYTSYKVDKVDVETVEIQRFVSSELRLARKHIYVRCKGYSEDGGGGPAVPFLE